MRKGSNRNFTWVFGDWTSFRTREIAILLQLLEIEPHFVLKLRRKFCKLQFYFSFWRSNFISCERVATGSRKSQFYLSFWRSNLVSCERVAFRAVSLALPRAFKREIEKKERARGQESKRAREQEGKRECQDVKMWRWEDVKMRRCEDEKMRRWRGQERMWRWEDEQMWRWEDVKMWGCEDEKIWRWTDVKMRRCEDVRMWRWEDVKMWICENVWQTPTIRRTLRSDAFLKKWLSNQKLRKSRWIAAFLMLSSSKAEEVPQNSFLFKLADR